MENPKLHTGVDKTAGDISASLSELRDALVELSLALKDWQFETDLEQRKIAEDTVRHLLENVASGRDRFS